MPCDAYISASPQNITIVSFLGSAIGMFAPAATTWTITQTGVGVVGTNTSPNGWALTFNWSGASGPMGNDGSTDTITVPSLANGDFTATVHVVENNPGDVIPIEDAPYVQLNYANGFTVCTGLPPSSSSSSASSVSSSSASSVSSSSHSSASSGSGSSGSGSSGSGSSGSSSSGSSSSGSSGSGSSVSSGSGSSGSIDPGCDYKIILAPLGTQGNCVPIIGMAWLAAVSGPCPPDTLFAVWRRIYPATTFTEIAVVMTQFFTDNDPTLPFNTQIDYYVRGIPSGTFSNVRSTSIGCTGSSSGSSQSSCACCAWEPVAVPNCAGWVPVPAPCGC